MALKHEIEQAIADHAAWKARFRDFINGKIELDAATVGKENHCQFGKWIEHEGERMLLPKVGTRRDIQPPRRIPPRRRHRCRKEK